MRSTRGLLLDCDRGCCCCGGILVGGGGNALGDVDNMVQMNGKEQTRNQRRRRPCVRRGQTMKGGRVFVNNMDEKKKDQGSFVVKTLLLCGDGVVVV